MKEKTLREHFQNKTDCFVTLFYDQWKCPGSTNRNQISDGPFTVDELLKNYGDFAYDGWYTTGFKKNGSEIAVLADVWATATDERRYKYPQIINPKEVVTALFEKGIEGEEAIELIEDTEKTVGYFDNENGYERIFHYDDTVETIEKRILMDEQVSKFISREKLADFLLKNLDPNALMCMEHIAFLYETEDIPSVVRSYLDRWYGDEYAWYIAELDSGILGQTWMDRQIPVINVSNIIRSSVEIANEPDEYHSETSIFVEGLLQTVFHECRHLFYECNEIVPIGQGTAYPQDGGVEDAVEDYGNRKACECLCEFKTDVVDRNTLEEEMPKMISECLGLTDREYE